MDHSSRRLPFALKGLDVIIYTVFRQLGLEVNFRPVLEDAASDDEWMEECDSDDVHSDASSDVSSEGETEKRRGPAAMVGTGMHEIQITERGGDESEAIQEVSAMCR